MPSTAPRTWVVNEVVTAAVMNVHVRDNLNTLSAHQHGGAAGDGAADLSSINRVGFQDQGASPGTTGLLQRRGGTLEYWAAGVLAVWGGDAVAGTASLRTIGTGAKQAAAGDHSHTINAQSDSGEDFATTNHAINYGNNILDTASEFATATVTFSKSGILFGGTQFVADNSGTGGNPWTLQLTIDSVLTVDTDFEGPRRGQATGDRSVSSGSRTVQGEIINDTGGLLRAVLYVQAFGVEIA